MNFQVFFDGSEAEGAIDTAITPLLNRVSTLEHDMAAMYHKPNDMAHHAELNPVASTIQCEPDNQLTQLTNAGTEPQVGDQGTQPQVEDRGTQPLVEDRGTQPQVEDRGTQPQVEDRGTQPQVEDRGTQPQVEDRGTQPQVEDR